MRVTLLNLTGQSISCRLAGKSNINIASEDIPLYPSQATTTQLTKSCQITLLPSDPVELPKDDQKSWPMNSEGLLLRVSLALGAPWRVVNVPEECPWRIYLSRITRRRTRLLILPRRTLASFLADMPDQLPLSSLCLPGTHDTMAFHGWPVSQCQELSTPLGAQLMSGIRMLDIRLAIIDSKLISYHGIYPQRTPFQEVLSTIHTFLTAPSTSRETLIMSIKQEDFEKNSYLDFSRLVHDEIFNGPGGRDMWYLKNKIPTLGEARGKVVLLSRFGGNGEGWEDGWEGLGIHPLNWPDSQQSGFTWQCKDTLVRTHDWYNLPSFLSIPEKFQLATQVLLPPANNPPMPTLSITFLSASSFPLALPPTIAKGFGWPNLGLGVEGVNSRFCQWLLDHLATDMPPEEKGTEQADGPRIRGWALMDYYAEPVAGLVPLLVECNYRGRRTGEEGW